MQFLSILSCEPSQRRICLRFIFLWSDQRRIEVPCSISYGHSSLIRLANLPYYGDETVSLFTDEAKCLKLISQTAFKDELWLVKAWENMKPWRRTIGYVQTRRAPIPNCTSYLLPSHLYHSVLVLPYSSHSFLLNISALLPAISLADLFPIFTLQLVLESESVRILDCSTTSTTRE